MPSNIGGIRMNIQVDLILHEEQRNANAFNMQALLRVMSIIGPAILILLVIMLLINSGKTKSELNNLEVQWQAIEAKKGKADNLRNQISANKDVLSKLNGIKNSRIEWGQQLLGLMEITPSNIQFRSLKITQKLNCS